MEAFVTHDKINLLVTELLISETWMTKVLPLMHKQVSERSGMKGYMCMFHQSSVSNLLEVILYHRTACESSQDALVELIDYCYRKFVDMNNKASEYSKARDEVPA
jgi:hypothetical protein